jgi:hypothetical protein
MYLTYSFGVNLLFQLGILAAYAVLLCVFYFIGGRNPAPAKGSAA